MPGRFLRCASLVVTILAWLAVAAGLLIERFIAERTVPTLVITYAPQAPWLLLPSLGSALSVLGRRFRLALANMVLAAFVIFGLMGFNVPWRPARGFGDVTVVSWNICGRLSDDVAVSRALARLGADVIVLQEAEGVSLPELEGYRRATGGDGIVILSRLPMEIHGDVTLGDPSYRRALWVSIRHRGKTVDVLGVHFSVLATGGSLRATLTQPLRARRLYLRRTGQARQIEAEAVLRWARARRNPTIVAGDLNTPPNCMVYRTLRSYLDDSFATAGWGRGLTYSQRRPLWRIDYVFTRGLNAASAEVMSAPTSDHRPFLCRLRFE